MVPWHPNFRILKYSVFIRWLVGLLVCWLVRWFVGWLDGWMVGWSVEIPASHILKCFLFFWHCLSSNSKMILFQHRCPSTPIP